MADQATLLNQTNSSGGLAGRRRQGAARAIGRIDVYLDAEAANARWTELEEAFPGTIYQTRRFLRPWIDAFAARASLAPMFVVAHDASGEPVAFVPLGVLKSGPFRIGKFLGGKDSNGNVGLYNPNVHFKHDDMISILRAAAAKSALRPDIFHLANQPECWEGRENPLDIFPRQPSASWLHGGRLRPDPSAFFKDKLSKDASKKLRKKRQRLEAMAPLTHVIAADEARARQLLNAFYEQKLARFRDKHIASVFETPESRRFLERATLDGLSQGKHAIELHGLMLGDRVLATYGGGAHRGHFHMMFNSFDADHEMAKSSPGDLLLMSILEAKCRDGMTGFDLGIGEARYKSMWCDETYPLFDSVVSASIKGRAYAGVESARLYAKRFVKQSSWAWPMALRLLGRD